MTRATNHPQDDPRREASHDRHRPSWQGGRRFPPARAADVAGNATGRRAKQPRRTRMPLEEIPSRPYQRGRGHRLDESFKCGHCKRFIGPVPSGGHHRNHCPFCLYSRHVDATHSGDRASACGALMAPLGAFQRPNGEHVVVHRCLGCGFERFNRIAADDDFDLVLGLPVVPPRSAREAPEAGTSGD